MKTLVLAEKPSVGRDIARVLGCKNGGHGYMEGAKHVVTWALGHLVTLADPEDYDKNYKTWDINHLPIMPKSLRLTVIPQTSKQYKTVKDLMHRKDISDIVIATDAGREGELVARWIIEMARCTKPIKRLWISSVTDKAIKEGFQNLKSGQAYYNLCESAKARAEADWLVGINATRCLTTKFNSQLSAGRVQTPTVAIIVKREEEIRSFTPRPFYGLTADTGAFRLTWQDKNNSARCFDKGKIEEIQRILKTTSQGTVSEIDKTIKKKNAPQLYDLTELQRDASKRYGYSPKETLSIMQKLYEEHKMLTYPRTDSRHISTDIVPTLPERLKACQVPPYAKMCTHALKNCTRLSKSYVDDAKVSDHHAIIPTETPANIHALGDKERKIYDLVITRFLSIFYPPYEYENTTLKIKIGTEFFVARGKVVLQQGYKAVYNTDFDDDDDAQDVSEKEQTLPKLKRFENIRIQSIKMTEGKTSPPALFNEATLLSAMENPAKYMNTQDKNIASTLQATGGLGTVATRADIIEKLYDNFLLEKRGNDIVSTSKGRQLLTLVPKDLKSPELTGNWEQILQRISTGHAKKEAFLQDIRKYTQDIIKEIKDSTATYRHDNLSSTKCPDCGMFMLAVKGKKGEMLVCQDRECNARVNVSMSIRSKCPKCYKFLNITGEGDRRMIVCQCGHREKYSTFEKRKAEEKNTMSKRDVEQYMSTMNKKNDKKNAASNPFAALSGKF